MSRISSSSRRITRSSVGTLEESQVIEERLKKLLRTRGEDVSPEEINIFDNVQEVPKLRRSVVERAVRYVACSTPMPLERQRDFNAEYCLDISPIDPISENDEDVPEEHGEFDLRDKTLRVVLTRRESPIEIINISDSTESDTSIKQVVNTQNETNKEVEVNPSENHANTGKVFVEVGTSPIVLEPKENNVIKQPTELEKVDSLASPCDAERKMVSDVNKTKAKRLHQLLERISQNPLNVSKVCEASGANEVVNKSVTNIVKQGTVDHVDTEADNAASLFKKVFMGKDSHTHQLELIKPGIKENSEVVKVLDCDKNHAALAGESSDVDSSIGSKGSEYIRSVENGSCPLSLFASVNKEGGTAYDEKVCEYNKNRPWRIDDDIYGLCRRSSYKPSFIKSEQEIQRERNYRDNSELIESDSGLILKGNLSVLTHTNAIEHAKTNKVHTYARLTQQNLQKYFQSLQCEKTNNERLESSGSKMSDLIIPIDNASYEYQATKNNVKKPNNRKNILGDTGTSRCNTNNISQNLNVQNEDGNRIPTLQKEDFMSASKTALDRYTNQVNTSSRKNILSIEEKNGSKRDKELSHYLHTSNVETVSNKSSNRKRTINKNTSNTRNRSTLHKNKKTQNDEFVNNNEDENLAPLHDLPLDTPTPENLSNKSPNKRRTLTRNMSNAKNISTSYKNKQIEVGNEFINNNGDEHLPFPHDSPLATPIVKGVPNKSLNGKRTLNKTRSNTRKKSTSSKTKQNQVDKELVSNNNGDENDLPLATPVSSNKSSNKKGILNKNMSITSNRRTSHKNTQTQADDLVSNHNENLAFPYDLPLSTPTVESVPNNNSNRKGTLNKSMASARNRSTSRKMTQTQADSELAGNDADEDLVFSHNSPLFTPIVDTVPNKSPNRLDKNKSIVSNRSTLHKNKQNEVDHEIASSNDADENLAYPLDDNDVPALVQRDVKKTKVSTNSKSNKRSKKPTSSVNKDSPQKPVTKQSRGRKIIPETDGVSSTTTDITETAGLRRSRRDRKATHRDFCGTLATHSERVYNLYNGLALCSTVDSTSIINTATKKRRATKKKKNDTEEAQETASKRTRTKQDKTKTQSRKSRVSKSKSISTVSKQNHKQADNIQSIQKNPENNTNDHSQRHLDIVHDSVSADIPENVAFNIMEMSNNEANNINKNGVVADSTTNSKNSERLTRSKSSNFLKDLSNNYIPHSDIQSKRVLQFSSDICERPLNCVEKVINGNKALDKDSGRSSMLKSTTLEESNARINKPLTGRISKNRKKQENANIAKVLSRSVIKSPKNLNDNDAITDNFSQMVNVTDDVRTRRSSIKMLKLINDDHINIMANDSVISLQYVNIAPKFKLIEDNIMVTDVRYVDGSSIGHLKLPPGGHKQLHLARKFSLLYSVVEGNGAVQVLNKVTNVKKLSTFVVPVGAEYAIHNLNKEEPMTLVFVKVPHKKVS